jgi:mycofactocin system transcriptional regulator
LRLFASRGFDRTTVEQIADAVGVNRRTLFRYFPSKNDIVWGDFDSVLDRLRRHLCESSPEEPLMRVLGRAIVASNSYPPDQLPELRTRLALITSVPSLQAHSMVRHAAWRRVVAEFAAKRLQVPVDDLLPQAIAHAAHGVAMTAFSVWVQDPNQDLEKNLQQGCDWLEHGFGRVRAR